MKLANIALIPDAASAIVGFLLVCRRADNQDKVRVADGLLHKLRKLLPWSKIPLIKLYVNVIA